MLAPRGVFLSGAIVDLPLPGHGRVWTSLRFSSFGQTRQQVAGSTSLWWASLACCRPLYASRPTPDLRSPTLCLAMAFTKSFQKVAFPWHTDVLVMMDHVALYEDISLFTATRASQFQTNFGIDGFLGKQT